MGPKMLSMVVAGSVLLLVAGVAQAQEPTPAPPPPPPAPAPPPPPPAAPAAAAPDGEMTDHERVVRRVAVGYFGLNNLPIGTGSPNNPTRGNIAAPVIGARYWLNKTLGIDVGLGLGFTAPEAQSVMGGTTTNANIASPFGFAIHGGVPIALASSKHFTFQVVPEANLGFTTSSQKNMNAPDTNFSGFHFDIGARIGAEVQFGFIGIPQLALQGSIGLFLTRETFKVSQDPNSSSVGSWTFGTTVGPDPWAIFTNQISALYYF